MTDDPTKAVRARFTRTVTYQREIPEDLTVIYNEFSSVNTPLIKVYQLVQNLSIISDVFSSIYTPLAVPLKALRVRLVRTVFYRREAPQEIIVSERFKVVKEILRKIIVNLSVIRDVFSYVYTPLIPPIYKFIQNLSVISIALVRRHSGIRKFIENLTVPLPAVIEDFNSYTEVDPNGHITVTANKVTFAGLIRNESAYVYKDFGVGHFGDFEHLITVRIDSMPIHTFSRWRIALWSLGNAVNDLFGMGTPNLAVIVVNIAAGDDTPRLVLSDSTTSDTSINLVLGTTYYLTISRSGTLLTCKIYDDADRTSLVDILTISPAIITTFRYIYTSQSMTSTVRPDQSINGFTENLDLQEVPRLIRALFTRNVAYYRGFLQSTLIQDAFKSIRGISRRLRQDLSTIQAIMVRSVSYFRRFVNQILVSDVFRWIRAILRRLTQNLSVLSVKVTRSKGSFYRLLQRIIIWVSLRRRVSIEDLINQLNVMSNVVGDALDKLKEKVEKVKAKFSLRR